MDERLQILDVRRNLPAGVVVDTPLVTLGWRALQAEHQRRARERQSFETERDRFREMIVRTGDEAYALRRLVQEGEPVEKSAQRLEEALAGIGAQVLSMVGEEYSSELMDVMENVAQRPDPHAVRPRIAEVILPAILWRGEVLRMGKVVVGLPIPPSGADGAAQSSERLWPHCLHYLRCHAGRVLTIRIRVVDVLMTA